jgi:hypothetical protein
MRDAATPMMEPSGPPALARLGAILAAATLLVWPALMNRYPIIFVDTAAYLLHTITGEAPWDKTAAYGPFLLLFHQGITLWLPLAAQGVILSWLLWLVQRNACGRVTPARHLVLSGGLAGLTSAPWFAAMLMPDVFTPVVVLCLFLLGFGERRLARAELLAVGLIGAVAIAVHLSHLPTAVALVLLVLLGRRQWRPALRAAMPLAAAIVFLLGANWHAFGRVTLSAHGAIFLLARLQADGPAVLALRDHCPTAGWYLCDFIDQMPMDSDHFLWSPESPVRPVGSVRLAPEAREVVAATLRDYPLAVARAALGNWIEQLYLVRVGDTLDNLDLDQFADQVLARGFPLRERAAFEAGAQMRGDLERLAAPFLQLHVPALFLSLPVILAGWWRLARRGDGPRLGLVLCVLVGVIANALATGALSKPHLRYQARIVWLLPLGAVLAFWPPSGGDAQHRTTPVAPQPGWPARADLAGAGHAGRRSRRARGALRADTADGASHRLTVPMRSAMSRVPCTGESRACRSSSSRM